MILNKMAAIVALFLSASLASAGETKQFVVELGAPLSGISAQTYEAHGVALVEVLSAGEDSYAVFEAQNQSTLNGLLSETRILPDKVTEVLFVNSPAVGGGEAAGVDPRDGHSVFVIERPIPGVGSLPLEQKQKISMGSNTAVEKLGQSIEWDHSYLTNEGTYCIYRADNAATVREHSKLAGAPIAKITAVAHEVAD